MENKYLEIVAHYESCLEKFGDTHLGVDWPDQNDANKRYKIMSELIKGESDSDVSLLDFGCGASHFYEYLQANNCRNIIYSGLDLSQKFIDLSKRKFPRNEYFCLDILNEKNDFPRFDYVVLNGVFTEKCGLHYEQMLNYFKALLVEVFSITQVGIAFNVMSKNVDWERDDLFHLPLDTLSDFLVNNISRNFIIRNDYGLYEYTVYVYR